MSATETAPGRLDAPSAARCAVGGALMGLANLVPGISGGTMLLAAGVYPLFVEAMSEITLLRFRARHFAVLGLVAGLAAAAILTMAGPVKDAVVEYPWIMYSLFIGLTFGGVPLVWRLVRPMKRAAWLGLAAGLTVMALFTFMRAGEGPSAKGAAAVALLFAAGLAGGAAMIMPGISGSYLLLLMGQYVPILAAIERFQEALRTGDWSAAGRVAAAVLLPTGLGVAAGVVGMSNGMRYLLRRRRAATLGVLLGLLLGAGLGLWPFRRGMPPEAGSVYKGLTMTEERLAALDPVDYPVVFFRPRAGQAAAAAGFVALGFVITVSLSRFGGREERSSAGTP